MIINTAFAGIVTLGLWLPASSSASLIVYAALYGFASGCTLSIIPAMVAKISDVRKLGVRNGTLYALSAVGVLIGAPSGGAIMNDQHGAFSGLKILCGVGLLLGTAFAIASRTAQVGLKLKANI
jgi:MFS family permease